MKESLSFEHCQIMNNTFGMLKIWNARTLARMKLGGRIYPNLAHARYCGCLKKRIKGSYVIFILC